MFVLLSGDARFRVQEKFSGGHETARNIPPALFASQGVGLVGASNGFQFSIVMMVNTTISASSPPGASARVRVGKEIDVVWRGSIIMLGELR